MGCQASVQAGGQASGPTGSQAPEATPCPNLTGSDQRVVLPAGTCEGDLVISGSNHQVTGAGTGQTIVSGGLLISGSNNRVGGVTVMGPGSISGSDNDVTGIEFRSDVNVSGVDNKR
jgi:hypothetical protein